MGKLLAAVVGLMVGCAARAPGDGRLVHVRLSGEVAEATHRVGCGIHCERKVSFAEEAERGARLWDEVGARLRTNVGGEWPAAVVDVVSAGQFEAGLAGAGPAWYSYVDGKVHINLAHSAYRGDSAYVSTLIAHELGHAMGLEHVDDERAVMHPAPGGCTRLADADLAEHARVW